ncbi:MAG: hypothetical protein ACOC47_00995 [Alkalispirochaetaceae bacterium]
MSRLTVTAWRIFALLMPALVAATAAAQAGDGAVGRRVAVAVGAIGEEGTEVIAGILETELGDTLERRDLTVVETVSDDAFAEAGISLPSESRMSTALGALGPFDADILVGAFYLPVEQELFVQFVLYDPAVETVIGGVLTRSRSGLTVFDSVGGALEEFEPVLDRYLAGGYFADDPENLVESITLTGATDGARVFFIDRLMGEVSRGELSVPYVQYELGTRLRIEAFREGYHDVERVEELDRSNVEVELPRMQRQTRFDAGLRWSFGLAQGAGVGVRVHLVPDELFVGAEHYRLFAPATDDRARDVQIYDYNLRLGRYFFFDYRSLLRFHLALGAGIYVSDVDDLDGREYTDWYAVLGEPTVELNLGRFDVFLRPDLRYALGIGYNTLGRIWVRTPYGIPPVTVGGRLSW